MMTQAFALPCSPSHLFCLLTYSAAGCCDRIAATSTIAVVVIVIVIASDSDDDDDEAMIEKITNVAERASVTWDHARRLIKEAGNHAGLAILSVQPILGRNDPHGLAELFARVDEDGSGTLEREEIAKVRPRPAVLLRCVWNESAI